MHINRISVRGLHGAIDAAMKFDSDLGIIVGINGSGKTSIINITAHLLRLNIPQLFRFEFELVRVSGRDRESRPVSISAKKSKGNLTLTLSRSKRVLERHKFLPLDMASEMGHREGAFLWDRHIRRTTPTFLKSQLIAFVREDVKLTLVRLDRTIFAEDFTGTIASDMPANSRLIPAQSGKHDPIEQVEHATRAKFTEFQNQQKRLNEELTNKLVLQLFQTTDIFLNRRQSRAETQAADAKRISALQKSIEKSSFYPKIESERKVISEYFRIARSLTKEFESIVSSAGSDRNLWQERFRRSAIDHFARLNTVAEEFRRFDEQVKEAHRDIRVYLDTINGFLRESSKEAFFSEVDNSLRFRLTGASDKLGRPISQLSSGEKQIVTVLAYLLFMSGTHSIFVIDEPELSLHLSWQMELVSALKALQPLGCQILMATHSPEVVGGHREKVVRLVPKYRANSVSEQ